MRQVIDTDIFSIIIHPMMFYLASMTFSKSVWYKKSSTLLHVFQNI